MKRDDILRRKVVLFMAKVGIPIMKLSSHHKGGQTKRSGNQTRALGEAFEERWSNAPDLDKSKTKDNVYFDENGCRVPSISGVELSKAFDEEAANYTETVTVKKGVHAGKTYTRGLKENAVTGFSIIVKPEGEFIDNLTPEEKERFWNDTREIMNDIMGKNPKTGRNNIRAMVIQKDEAHEHLHCGGMPYDKDGRLCSANVFKLTLYRRFNEEYPQRMREKGWQIDNCTSYDVERMQELEKEAKALEEQGRTAEAEEKRAEIEYTKEYHVKNKKKSGLSKRDYLDNKNRETEERLKKEEKYLNVRKEDLKELADDIKEQRRLLAEEREALEKEKAELRRREEACGLAEKAKKFQNTNIAPPTEPQNAHTSLMNTYF